MNFVGNLVEGVRNRFQNMWSSNTDTPASPVASTQSLESTSTVPTPLNEVVGFTMNTDPANKRTKVLVQTSENAWQTQWFNDSETAYKQPDYPMERIFK